MNNEVFEKGEPVYFTFEVQIKVGGSWVTMRLDDQVKYICLSDATRALHKFRDNAKDSDRVLHKEARNCRIARYDTQHTMSFYI